MPRLSRVKSNTGVYHIMLRGINQQLIFEDDEDNEKFLEILGFCKTLSGFELYSYCLMGNHIHILLKTINEDLDLIFKRIGARYVYWYNRKYKRTGHLFQDRFRSEPVCDDTYFLTVLRYIHQNPMKAKLCKNPDDYKWSSYNEYINNSYDNSIVDTAFALNMTGIVELIMYTNMSNTDNCLEYAERKFVPTDVEARKLMMELCKCNTTEGVKAFNTQQRDEYIRALVNSGISVRQLSRISGVSKGIIKKVLMS